MAYAETLQTKIKEYCRVKNIPMARGKVPDRYKKEIETLIFREIRRSRKAYAISHASPSIKEIVQRMKNAPQEND